MGNDLIINEPSLNKYSIAISTFENIYRKEHYNNYPFNSKHKGYLIYLKNYERIAQSIININRNNVDINKYKQSLKIKQIEFKTAHYLINMILNGNKYIFINKELWQLLCDKDKKDESPIIYQVNSNDITFTLPDKNTLSFSHNKNIIDENSYQGTEYRNNYKIITNIYENIINYYDFENKILNDIKNKECSKDTTYAFLINKNLIDKWKKISYYEYIKEHYLQKNRNNKNDIINALIYYLEKNEIEYNIKFGPVNALKCNKKEELESYLKNDSLILIEPKFFSSFKADNSEKKFNIKLLIIKFIFI